MVRHRWWMAGRWPRASAQLRKHHFARAAELVGRRVRRRPVRRMMVWGRHRAGARRRNWLVTGRRYRSRRWIGLRRTNRRRRTNRLHELLLYRNPRRSHHTLRRLNWRRCRLQAGLTVALFVETAVTCNDPDIPSVYTTLHITRNVPVTFPHFQSSRLENTSIL